MAPAPTEPPGPLGEPGVLRSGYWGRPGAKGHPAPPHPGEGDAGPRLAQASERPGVGAGGGNENSRAGARRDRTGRLGQRGGGRCPALLSFRSPPSRPAHRLRDTPRSRGGSATCWSVCVCAPGWVPKVLGMRPRPRTRSPEPLPLPQRLGRQGALSAGRRFSSSGRKGPLPLPSED